MHWQLTLRSERGPGRLVVVVHVVLDVQGDAGPFRLAADPETVEKNTAETIEIALL